MPDLGTLLLLALLVVCPLTMFWMMRHGHGGSGEGESDGPEHEPPVRILTPLRPEDQPNPAQRELGTKQPPAPTNGRARR